MSQPARPAPQIARRYGSVAILFHWAIAAAVIALFLIGWQMAAMPRSPEKGQLFAIHKSIGLTVLGLTILRLAWRATHKPPPLPPDLPRWQVILATASHRSLYLLLVLLPLSGWLLSSVAGAPISWFGMVAVPPISPAAPAMRDVSDAAHILLGWLMLALFGLHLVATLHHQLILRDGILGRMLPRLLLRSSRG